MSHIIYLYPDEQEMFSSVPDKLCKNVESKPEEQTSFETDDQLHMRYRMAQLDRVAPLETFLEAMQNSVSWSRLQFDQFDEDFQKEILFLIGAKGVDCLVKNLLSHVETDDDMSDLISLTQARHELLFINASSLSNG